MSKIAVLLAVLALVLSYRIEQGLPTTSAQTSKSLEPGTILLLHDLRFWRLNRDDWSVQLYLDPDLPSGVEIGDAHISPGGRFIYFNVHFKSGLTESDAKVPDQLIQFNTTNRNSRVLLERTWLSRLTPISPDGKKAILTFHKPSDRPEMDSYCLVDTETGDCPEISLIFDQNDLFWIDDDSFVTTPLDGVLIYTIGGTASLEPRTLKVDNWLRWPATITPDRRFLIVSGYRHTDSNYVPGLILVDLKTSEVSDLPYKIREIGAAVSHVGISPDGSYLAIQRALSLDVVDLRSGEPVLSIDDIGRFVWSSDSQSLVIVRAVGFLTEDLLRVDVATGKFTDPIRFSVEKLSGQGRSAEVYLLVVP